jgi:hypothetical protein
MLSSAVFGLAMIVFLNQKLQTKYFLIIKLIKMKTKYILTAIAAAIIFTAQLSCTKEAQSPSATSVADSENKNTVTHSDWFSAEWQTTNSINEYSKNVTEITADLLKNGKVLVFGRGGFEERQATTLPSYFDGNFIDYSVMPGTIKFSLKGGAAVSQNLFFRSITIPATQLVPATSLNYSDYHAVCNYYKIDE